MPLSCARNYLNGKFYVYLTTIFKKRSEAPARATTWRNLDNDTECKRPDTKGHVGFHFFCEVSWTGSSPQRQKVDSWFPGAGRQGCDSQWQQVSFESDQYVLKLRQSYTALWTNALKPSELCISKWWNSMTYEPDFNNTVREKKGKRKSK